MKMRESRDHLIYKLFSFGPFLLFLHYLFTSVFVRIRINSSGVEVGLGPATIKFQAQYKIGRLSPHLLRTFQTANGTFQTANGTFQKANGKQFLSRFSGGWGAKSNFPPQLVTKGGPIYLFRQGCT